MTGGYLIGLILLSMGWMFFLGGVAMNWHAVRARKGGIPVLPGLIGSLTVFFTIPAVKLHGVEVPWPWLWILLPLVIDPYWIRFGRR